MGCFPNSGAFLYASRAESADTAAGCLSDFFGGIHDDFVRGSERPFFFFLDECQLYLSGDVSRFLTESRKWGVGMILSSQTLGSFRLADTGILDAIKNCTNVKVAFRTKDTVEAAELADMVLGYDLEMPVNALTKPTVVGHRLTTLKSDSVSRQSAISAMQTETEGGSFTESCGWAESSAETIGDAIGTAESDATMSAQAASNASASGSGTGNMVTNTLTVDTNLFGTPTIIGIAEGESSQSNRSEIAGSSSSQGRSSSTSNSRSSSRATTTGSSTTEGVAYTTSSSRSVGTAATKGEAENSWRAGSFRACL